MWKLTTTESCDGRHTRVYKSDCGKIGMVVRTPAYGPVDCRAYGKPRVKYFIWGKSDNAPEYDNLEDCKNLILQADETG